MRWTSRLLVIAMTLCNVVAQADDAHDPFEKSVRPVLLGTCFKCHGGQKVSGGLRVDSLEALLKGGDSGPAIVPGKPDQSLLAKAIRRYEDVSAMPPGMALPAPQVEAIVEWIAAGAVWPPTTAKFETAKHWAYEPVQSPALPSPKNAMWGQSSIDSFILAKQESLGLSPSSPASRQVLIRRVTYDLTGLPPTMQAVEEFERDPRPTKEAFADLVEKLLASPQYGEHWGRHWLDVVRYADTAGENSDHPLPHAWRYRNWVIDALNADKPYDQFIQEQIAGDLLAKDGPPDQFASRTIATGYLSISRRFGHEIDKDLYLTYEDAIDNLGKSVLGLTIACSRCHDHKYDAITVEDYYGLYGVLASTKLSFPGCEPQQQPRDLIPLLPPSEVEAIRAARKQKVDALEAELKQPAVGEPELLAKIAAAIAATKRTLATGEVPEAGSLDIASTDPQTLQQIAVRKGELLQLTVLAHGNHGADTTLVELQIAEVGGEGRTWSTTDIVNRPGELNPHPGAAGATPTWAFLDLNNGPRLLPEKLESHSGFEAIKFWRNGDTPSVFVNSSDQPIQVWTTLPAKSFGMHPGPSGPVAVAWMCPIDGVVQVTGRVADAHPGGPEGVDYALDLFASAELAPALAALAEGAQLRAANEKRRREELGPEPVIPVAYAVADGTPGNTKIQRRGDPADLGEEAPRRFLGVLGGTDLASPTSSGRLDLARALTSPTNPLTARVIANRVWQWHFGRGIVASPNDFGVRGTPPTHPELLDHLATEFMQSGWSLKALHRRILLSATYQQATGTAQDAPWLTAFPRRRLTAEELRDSLLAISGQLDLTAGQGHPFPPESTWGFTQHGPFAAEYETAKRSVYVMQKRNRRSRFFSLFDGVDPNASSPVRDVTTVPTQALFFMNDPLVHAQASQLAKTLLATGATDESRLLIATRTLYGREPRAGELESLRAYKQDLSSLSPSVSSGDLDLAVWESYCRILLSSNEFLYVD